MGLDDTDRAPELSDLFNIVHDVTGQRSSIAVSAHENAG